MRVTRPNLLTWHDSAVDLNALPYASPDCRSTPLITYAGEVTTFYQNLVTPVTDPGIAPILQLVEHRMSGVATNAVANLSGDPVTSGHFCLYGYMTCPAVGPGLYRWKLTWGTSVWVSSLIQVMSEADARASSIRVEFTHPITLHGVRYPWIQGGLTCQMRLRAYLNGIPEYPVETSAYREATTAITRNYNTASDKLLKFQLPYSDADLLEGVEFVLLHDTILINGRSVTTRDHMSATSGKSKLAPATFSVLDNSYANPLIP